MIGEIGAHCLEGICGADEGRARAHKTAARDGFDPAVEPESVSRCEESREGIGGVDPAVECVRQDCAVLVRRSAVLVRRFAVPLRRSAVLVRRSAVHTLRL